MKAIAGFKKISTFATAIGRDAIKRNFGALVQLVRIHACHAWGHGFESRTHRFLKEIKKENPLILNESEDFLFMLNVLVYLFLHSIISPFQINSSPRKSGSEGS